MLLANLYIRWLLKLESMISYTYVLFGIPSFAAAIVVPGGPRAEVAIVVEIVRLSFGGEVELPAKVHKRLVYLKVRDRAFITALPGRRCFNHGYNKATTR